MPAQLSSPQRSARESAAATLPDRGELAASAHLRTCAELTEQLASDPERGLSSAEAAARLVSDGENAIREQESAGPLRIVLAQLTDTMILVLLAAALISALIGDAIDALVILVIVALNAVIGFAQEYRAERALAAIKALAAPEAHVLRDGETRVRPARELVVGDQVLLEAGNAVPADLRLLEANGLRIDESALTGESEPVDKQVQALADTAHALGDRTNIAHKGTLVARGRGRGVVVATGMRTALGKVAQLLDTGSRLQTPLQQRLARFARVLTVVVLALCALLFLLGMLRGQPPLLMALTSISLAVAAIPEALPAVVSVSLALGARTLLRRQVLVRKLPAVETLGSVTFICSDKTGTLTENRMRAERLWACGTSLAPAPSVAADASFAPLLRACALNHDVTRSHEGVLSGDPTEVALVDAVAACGLDPDALREQYPRLAEISFDASRARMSTLHADPAGVLLLVKGAPEQLLPRCRDVWTGQGTQPLDRAMLDATVEAMAQDGLRVLAVARRILPDMVEPPEPLEPETLEAELSLVGLVGLFDPPRAEARDAVELCRQAGIVPVMITGDHPATASTIARRLGIAHDEGEVVTGSALAQLSQDELAELVGHARVYARSDPEHKISIVQALQDRGEFVAMTGDGVNDAPALKRANIGVAMGQMGTDVAKEAADMVLLDDNFASIVSAVREGRRVFDNIRKFIRYTMTSNSGELWTLIGAPLLGLPIPLLPIHILWINLVTDGLPGLALALEPEEEGLMQRPPRPPSESIFAHGMWQHIVVVGLLMGACSLVSQWVAREQGWPAQTVVFTVLTFAQLGHALAVRSERQSLWHQGLWSNRALLLAVGSTALLQLATLYVEPLSRLLKTEPLSAPQLAFCLLLSSVVFWVVELEKVLVRRGVLYRAPAGES